MRKIFLTIAVVVALLCPISVALAGDMDNPGYCSVNVCPPPEPTPCPPAAECNPNGFAQTGNENENDEDEQSLLNELLRLLGL